MIPWWYLDLWNFCQNGLKTPENQPSWRPNNFYKNKQIITIQKQTNTVGATLHKFISKYLNFLCSWSNKSMFAPFLKRRVGIVGTEKNVLLEINLSWTILNSRFDNNGFIRLNCTLGHPLFSLSLLSSDRPKFLAFSKQKAQRRSSTVFHLK